MTHLGDRVCDLVDGRLTPAETERAHAHLASCRPCRDLVEVERLTKARLAALGDPAPASDFLERLLALGSPTAGATASVATDETSRVPVAAAVDAGTVSAAATATAAAHAPDAARSRTVAVGGTRAPGAASAAGRRPSGSSRPSPSGRPGRPAPRYGRFGRRAPRARLAAAVIGALGAVGAGMTALAATAPTATASVVPAVDSFVVQHVAATVRLPILDIPAGWQLIRRGASGSSGEDGSSGR